MKQIYIGDQTWKYITDWSCVTIWTPPPVRRIQVSIAEVTGEAQDQSARDQFEEYRPSVQLEQVEQWIVHNLL